MIDIVVGVVIGVLVFGLLVIIADYFWEYYL